jgi:transcriptional regulator GlxA family with amidase domain
MGERTTNFGFLLFDGFSLLTIASAIEPLRQANRLSGGIRYRYCLLSKDGLAVNSSSGLALQTTAIEDAPTGMDWIVVVAGFGLDRQCDSVIYRYLQKAVAHGASIGAMNVGSFVLARAGLLQGYRCTVHWESIRQFTEEFPTVEVKREIYVRDRSRLTCGGGAAGLDMMLALIAADYGAQLAGDVADRFMLSSIRGPDEQQRLAVHRRYRVHDVRVAKAVGLMEMNLENLMPVKDIASQCHMSVRQLERLCQQHFMCSPNHFYMKLRLNEARTLLKESTESIAKIAMRCGFSSASHFGTAYTKLFGHSPGKERRES